MGLVKQNLLQSRLVSFLETSRMIESCVSQLSRNFPMAHSVIESNDASRNSRDMQQNILSLIIPSDFPFSISGCFATHCAVCCLQ